MKRFALSLAAALLVLSCRAQPLASGFAASAETARPLAAGAKAPTAILPAQDGADTDLAKVFARKPTVLIFYRGGWCPYCNRHLAALAESELDLVKLGYHVVAISPEPIAKLRATADEHHLRYRLLSDEKALLSRRFGVAYRISAETGTGYASNGITLTHIPDSTDFWLPVPAAFLIDPTGTIKYVYWNADPSIRVSTDDLLAAAQKALEP